MNRKSREETVNDLHQMLRGLDAPLAEAAAASNALLVQEEDVSIGGAAQQYWELLAITNAVLKARFLLNDLIVIGTASLLAVTRYLFELVVWLKHLQLDPRYAVLLAHESFRLQVEHFGKLAAHLQREADLYRRLGAEESKAQDESIQQMRDGSIAPADIGDHLRAISADVDRHLAENFAFFADDVQWNGYGFQTHLIETKILPANGEEEIKARAALEVFEARWNGVLGELRMPAKWAKRAEAVEMSAEYEFIYSYTSRLLHATPASFLTNEKTLTALEIATLLRYAHIQFRWIISCAVGRCAGRL